MSEALEKARQYEKEYGEQIPNEERPKFHLSPAVGWMNDPNGLSYYQGNYHMFYQYNPYDTVWGPMHWGHAVSTDLLHWEYLPAALAPDEVYDKAGCFSGSAVELADGRHLILYTGVRKEKKDHGEFIEFQTQCVAVGDGIHYEKYANNPVLDEKDLPEGASRTDFRDPKIWRSLDGTYRCVVGSRAADESGQILLFTSEDAFRWKFEKVLVSNHNRFGKMWECPDYFALDGHVVLLTSPMEMLPRGLEFHNGNGTLCMIGNRGEDGESFVEQYEQSIDYGIDFYAPQTVMTPDGRRVMIGWMQNWETCMVRPDHAKWFGQMTIPRELSIKNGRLIQKPVREIEENRRNEVHYEDIAFTGTIQLDGIKGRQIDMIMEIEAADPMRVYHKFAVCFAKKEEYQTSFSYRPHEGTLKVDRKFSGSRRGAIHQRRCLVPTEHGKLKLRLILDSFSAELFVNDGEKVMTTTFYTPLDAENISFFAEGKVTMNVTKYDLK